MLLAGKIGDHRMRAGRDQDGLGGERGVAVGELHLMRAFQHGAGEEAVDPRPLQGAGIDAVQPVDLALDVVDQRRPVEAQILASPAEAARIGEIAAVLAAIDQQLLRHAAADHAGAADAIFLGDADARAELGRKPRRADPARARANDEQIVVVLSQLASGSCAAQSSDAAFARHDSQIGEPKKQPVLDHAGHAFQGKGEHLGLGDGAEGAIEDEIALVGDERRVARSWPERDRAVAARSRPRSPRSAASSPAARSAPPRPAAGRCRARRPACSHRRSPPCGPRRSPRSSRAAARRRRP